LKNERVIEVWNACVEAMRGVVREHRITEDELLVAGQYFNRLGQSGMFPSLLTVSLVMTSADLARGNSGATRTNPQGPFYKADPPFRATGALFEREPGADAVILTIAGRVTDAGTGEALAGVELDFWQADEYGVYDNDGYHLRGVVRTDDAGNYRVRTVVAKDYEEHDSDPIGELYRAMGRHNRRCGHIHLKVRRSGFAPLTTQVYMDGSPYLDSDYVEGAVSPDLTLQFQDVPGAQRKEVTSTFDIRLRQAAAPADSRAPR
jgi:protocatechuate 3,4-dioxygenase beta subunit